MSAHRPSSVSALPAAILAVLAASTLAPTTAEAADVLFVTDSGGAMDIATVLAGDGHAVTTVAGTFSGGTNPALTGDLSAYDAVVWNQDGLCGCGEEVSDVALVENLERYVRGGGYLLITGVRAVTASFAGPFIRFVGAQGSLPLGDTCTIGDVETSLSVGVVDIRGIAPTGGVAPESLRLLGADVTTVCGTSAPLVAGQWTVRRTGAGEAAFVSVGFVSPDWSITTADGAGAYNAALRNFVHAAEVAAGPAGSPQVVFDAPAVVTEGDAIRYEVTVSDPEGDPSTFAWDLDGDGVFGELSGESTHLVPAGTTDGPSALVVSVRASDGTNSRVRRWALLVENAPPAIVSTPPTAAVSGERVRYEVLVDDPGEDGDPPVFRVVSGNGVFIDDVFAWTATDRDAIRGTASFEILVDDGDEGTTGQTWEVTVGPNTVPTAPTPVSPADGATIAEATPRLTVTNGTDADGDPLVYFFELDYEKTFRASVIERSAAVLEDASGTTSYDVTTELAPGRYFWRAWSWDGAVASERRRASFRVGVLDVDAGAAAPDASASDAGAAPAARGCSAQHRGAGAPWSLVLGLVLSGLRRRRFAAP